MKPLTCLLFCALVQITITESVRFYVIRQWKYINFTWPNEDSLKTATSKGLYIPENIILSGVKYYNDYFYITLPRMKSGVPATLARIHVGSGQSNSPDLEPFPSWEMNNFEDCNNLRNVQNVEIDTRGQMWIIDGGRVETIMHPVGLTKCAPKLVIYDIDGKRVTTVYHFPEDVASKEGSYLYDLVVDNTDGGFAYITDNSVNDPGLIVYSVKENRSWKIRDMKTMTADESAIEFTVNEVPVKAPINVAGIALGPKIHTSNNKVVVNEEREVYFSPLSSLHLYSINTTILKNENISKNLSNDQQIIKDVGLKASQSTSMIMDNQGILFYSLLANNAIGRWDSHTPFQSGQKIIAQDNKHLEWPSSFTFDRNGNLTVLTNRMNKFVFDKINLDEYNFRLITSHVGGMSYIFDENFNYNSGNDQRRMNEATSTTEFQPRDEPKPEPESNHEPKPEPQPSPHMEHEVSTKPNDSNQNQKSTSEASQREIHNAKASACRFVSSFLILVTLIIFLA